MLLKYYVNAMILIQGQNTKVLCDPWITFNRVSTSGLYNFPETNFTVDDILSINPDFIYISHTHADHFDPVTLELFPRNTPILVCHYPNNFTKRNIEKLGFTDVRVVDSVLGQRLNGGDHCWIEPNAVYPDVDSIITLRIDGETVVNVNDNPFCESQCRKIRDRFGPLTLACVPFSFQGPYPAFYRSLSQQELESEASKKKLNNFNIMTNFLKALNPRYFFPFAAGAIYEGERAMMYPYYGVGTLHEASEYAKGSDVSTEVLKLSSGMDYDFSSHTYSGEYLERSFADEYEYISHVSKIKTKFSIGGAFYIAESEHIDLTKLLTRARQRQYEWQLSKNIVSDWCYYLDVGASHLYRFSLQDVSVERIQRNAICDKKFEIFVLPYSLLIGVLTGHYNWSNVKTQYIWFERHPNIFQKDLHILMSYLQL